MNADRCSVDALRLIAFLRDPSADPDLPAHIAACRNCQIRLFRLAAAANTTRLRRHLNQSNIEDWFDLFDSLPDDTIDLSFSAEQADLFIHMLTCAECFERYQEVRHMTNLVLSDSLPPTSIDAYRPPDLSFLRASWTWLTAPLAAAREGLLRVLRIDVGMLLQRPQLAPALMQREAAPPPAVESTPYIQRVTLGAEDLGSLEVSVRLLPVSLDASAAQLEVEVFLSERLDLDFSGTAVLMRLPDRREITRTTDADGYVRFDPLPEEDLRGAILEITP